MVDETEKKEVKEVKERYGVAEIATKTDQIIIDTKDNKQYNELTFLAKIANDIEQIKKSLG
ncbi:hypothetical protein LCGC14_2956400 [marine sediment metagenome]|uniref:Uncharacterized protein n=1 Tax=marine sediment metagenome TaxID=412755 RepID=A0A0F8XDD0_9ZZZZ